MTLKVLASVLALLRGLSDSAFPSSFGPGLLSQAASDNEAVISLLKNTFREAGGFNYLLELMASPNQDVCSAAFITFGEAVTNCEQNKVSL